MPHTNTMTNQENMYTYGGKPYHITITPLMARQLDDLADEKRNLSAIIDKAIERLYANVASNMQPVPGTEPVEPEAMPDGDPLTALCKLWDAKQQEVVKIALWDAWREWKGML